MATKRLFLSDTIKRACSTIKDNFGFLCLAEFIYWSLLSTVFVVSSAIASGILLHVGVHNMVAHILREYTQIQADATLQASEKAVHLVAVLLHIMGDSVWIILGAASIFLCFFLILWAGFSLGYQKIMLNLYDSKPASLGLLFSGMAKLPSYIIARAIYLLAMLFSGPLWVLSIMVMANVFKGDAVRAIYIFMIASSFLFFLLLGLVIAVIFGLFYLFIVDSNVGPIASLKNSYRTTKGHVLKLSCWYLGYSLIIGCVSGILNQFIAVLFYIVAYWFGSFCYIAIYRQLLQENSDIVTKHQAIE